LISVQLEDFKPVSGMPLKRVIKTAVMPLCPALCSRK